MPLGLGGDADVAKALVQIDALGLMAQLLKRDEETEIEMSRRSGAAGLIID